MGAVAERTAATRSTGRAAASVPLQVAAKPTHRADIQGLRGIAVLLVVFGHAGVDFLRGGYVGVDVFFVLSGFLITGLLLAEGSKRGSISLSGFYCRRARRILPAAGVTLLATMLAATCLLNFVRARVAVWDAIAATGFAANLRFARLGTDYFAQSQPPSPVLHFWSLAVEEQFYLIWPALLSLVLLGSWTGRRRPHRGFHRGRLLTVVVLGGSLSLAWSVWQTRELPQVAYFSPFTRAWELALGAALAIGAGASGTWHLRWRALTGWLGLAAIAAAAVIYTDSTPFPGTAALLPALGAALVIWAGIGSRIAAIAPARLLALQPLRYVGDCSYSLYLWHWPLLAIAPLYLGHRLSLPANLALVSAAFVLAIASYEAVENPIRKARWSGTRTALVFAASTAVVLVGAAASLAAISNERTRFETRAPVPERSTTLPMARGSVANRHATSEDALPEVVAAVQAALRDDPLPAGLTPPVEHVGAVPPQYVLPRGCVPVAASNDSSSLVCRVGQTTSRRTLVLIGDSHAQMWLPAVLRLAERDGWLVIPVLRPGCTPDTWVDERGLGACRPWFRWATGQVRLLRPEVTLVGGAVGATTGATARAAVHGLLTMIRELRPASRRVVTIGDPEGLIRNPVDCLLAPHASMGTCTTTWPTWRLEPYDRVAAGAKKLGAGFIDNRGWFCFERHCPTVIDHTIAYRDWHHITVTYALHLAPVFRSTLRQLHIG